MLTPLEKIIMILAIVLGAGIGLFALAVFLADHGVNPWELFT